jgi:hypothetical protein
MVIAVEPAETVPVVAAIKLAGLAMKLTVAALKGEAAF